MTLTFFSGKTRFINNAASNKSMDVEVTAATFLFGLSVIFYVVAGGFAPRRRNRSTFSLDERNA